MFTPRKVHLTTLALIVWFVSASPPLGAQGVAEPGVKHQGRLKTPPGTAEDEKEAITRYVAAQDGGVAAIGPRLITYQGLIENVGGPIDNQSMVVEFRAWNALEGGNPRAVAVSKTLSASQLRRGVFSVEMDADQLALPDNADDTYLEVAVCSPSPCTPVALAPRQHVTAAALAVSARSLGGAARAEADGSLVVESSAAASGVMNLKSPGATEAMSLSAADRLVSAYRSSGASSLKMQALSVNGDSTEAFLDDAVGAMTLSKVTVIADDATAAISTKSLQFSANGEIAALRDAAAAPLRLSSNSPTGETILLLDDASYTATFAREEAAATAGISPPPKLVLYPQTGSIAAAVDAGSATMTLISTSASGDKTQIFIDDVSSKVTISKEVAALNTAAPSSKKLVMDAAAGTLEAVRSTGSAPLALISSTSATNRTQLLLDDALGKVTISKEAAALNTAAPSSKKLVMDAAAGTIAAAVDSGSATMTLMSTTGVANKTQIFLDDTLGKVTISKEAAASNTAAASSKKLVIDAANGSVAAFDGTNAAAVRFKTGDTLAMEIDPTTNTVIALGAGGFKAGKILIDAAVASNTAGPSPVVEFVPAPGQLELKVDGNVVDRWTGLGLIDVAFGQAPNRISGNPGNSVKPGVFGAAVTGGGSVVPNEVTDHLCTIGGGTANHAGIDDGDPFNGWFATVGGGYYNRALGPYNTIAGGNGILTQGTFATVGGGGANQATANGSTIGGGLSNSAGAYGAAVAGGVSNSASGYESAIGGGDHNTASSSYATVPGGYKNSAAGAASFAAGIQAKANFDGMFVWGDASFLDFPSSTEANFTPGANEFLVKSTGGVYIVTSVNGSGDSTAGVKVAAGGGSWSSLSDRKAKDNVVPTDGREVLERLSSIPVATWNYKSQDASIRHMGPMAQDFHAAFGIGEDEKFITTTDADGVALAAIQGVYEIVQEKDCEIEELRSEIADLKEIVYALSKQNGGGR